MNIGIISTSKKINFQNLPNNTYLIFYVSKTKKNKNRIGNSSTCSIRKLY